MTFLCVGQEKLAYQTRHGKKTDRRYTLFTGRRERVWEEMGRLSLRLYQEREEKGCTPGKKKCDVLCGRKEKARHLQVLRKAAPAKKRPLLPAFAAQQTGKKGKRTRTARGRKKIGDDDRPCTAQKKEKKQFLCKPEETGQKKTARVPLLTKGPSQKESPSIPRKGGEKHLLPS